MANLGHQILPAGLDGIEVLPMDELIGLPPQQVVGIPEGLRINIGVTLDGRGGYGILLRTNDGGWYMGYASSFELQDDEQWVVVPVGDAATRLEITAMHFAVMHLNHLGITTCVIDTDSRWLPRFLNAQVPIPPHLFPDVETLFVNLWELTAGLRGVRRDQNEAAQHLAVLGERSGQIDVPYPHPPPCPIMGILLARDVDRFAADGDDGDD